MKKRGLSKEQRYEGLALRAIALHKIDLLLGSVETGDSERGTAQAQWVLSTTTRAELAKRIGPALIQAVQAWGALGAARSSEAKPYSTARTTELMMNQMGFPEATPLQETSALLDQIVRERTGQTGAAPSRPSP